METIWPKNSRLSRTCLWMLVSFLATFGCLTACRRSTVKDHTQQLPDQATASVPGVIPADARLTAIELKMVVDRKEADRTLLDPSHDGWSSEEFAEQAKQQLLQLFSLHATAQGMARAKTLGWAEHAQFVNAPNDLKLAFSDSGVQVLRPAIELQEIEAHKTDGRSEPLFVVIEKMASRLTQYGKPEFSIKVIGVDVARELASTQVLFEAEAANDRGSVQQTARFDCNWDLSTSPKQLKQLRCVDFEEARLDSGNRHAFSDCTAAVFGSESAYREQLAFGLNYWADRIERAHGMDDSVRNGLAIADLNGDGRDDVYVCQGPGLPNRLLLQNADGTVTDDAKDAGVNFLDQTSSALAVDLDNDGDQDLAIATSAGLLVLENDSKCHFTLRRNLGSKHCDAQSLTAADFDNNGYVDLFLCVYRPDQVGRRGDFVFHDATTGGSNRLFRNTGDWSFTDVTQDVGLGDGATRYSLASAWEDFDDDGDQDLYVANDYGRNLLYRNDAGRFVDVTDEVGLADTGFGMSASWGDVNRDGRMDLYIGNMFSSAGNRITNQRGFQEHSTPQQRAVYRRMAQGNSLFTQDEKNRFHDASIASHVRMGRWAWSSVFSDINNDGWEDLLVANGYITANDTTDL